MKFLKQALADGYLLLDLKADDLPSIFHQTLNFVVARGLLSTDKRDEVEAALVAREPEAPTALGQGIAVPHAYAEFITQPVVVFVRLARPLNLGAPDDVPTRFLFVLLGPPGREAEHLDTLAQIVRLMSDDEFRYRAGIASSKQELIEALDDFRQRTRPAKPPPQQISDAMCFTGRPFGGLVADIRRRVPHYLSDFTDGLTAKSVSSVLFLFFACLAPAVTFGGFMALETGGQIGAAEMIVASAICGIVFALCSGQPLIILGGTGPLLVSRAFFTSSAATWGLVHISSLDRAVDGVLLHLARRDRRKLPDAIFHPVHR